MVIHKLIKVMKLNSFQPFQNNAFLHGWLSLAFLLFGLMPNYAQIICGGGNVSELCLRYPAQSYTYIDGNYDAPSLYGAQLLTPAQALNNPQYLLVKGQVTFTEDYSFADGSNIVFLDNNSGFRVTASAELLLDNSYLNGCTQLWAGVEVLPGSTITARKSHFQDAKAAIILRDNVKVEITDNSFTQNVCGILAVPTEANSSTTASVFLASNKGITGNKFTGNGQLLQGAVPGTIAAGLFLNLPITATQFPYAGIWLERINFLTIGETEQALNIFHDFGLNFESNLIQTSGIRSIHSNVIIKNSKFDRIGYYIPDSPTGSIQIIGFAIHALNNAISNKQTTVEGIAPNPQGLNMFSDCYRDIFTSGTNLTVGNTTSYRAFESIIAQTAGTWQNSIKIEIKKSQINSFREEGITLRYHRPISFAIEDNLIADNDEEHDPVQRFGILLEALVPYEIPIKNGRVINNVINSSSLPSSTTFFGIAVRRTSFFNIEQNKISDALSPSNLAAFYGIRGLAVPCNGLDIRFNTINGSGLNYVFATGIDLRESLNSKVYCNFTDNINTGMLFAGICDNLDLQRNDFMYHSVGLSIGSAHPFLNNYQFNPIGPQINKENRWIGANSPIEAFVLNEASALASRFWINSTDLNSVFWPFPRKIGSNDDNFIWFLPSTTGPPASGAECALEGPLPPEAGLTDTDEEILNGTYQEPWGFAAMDWEARWHLTDRLHRNTEWLEMNNGVSTYYQNTAQATYSRLNGVYQGFLNRWHPDHILSNQAEYITDALSDALAQRRALDGALSNNPAANATLHQQMLELDGDIVEWSDSLEAVCTQLLALVEQQVSDLMTQADNVSCTLPYEADMKTVLQTMLQAHFTEGELSHAQSVAIETIAAKCRYSGGYAVVLARAFFEQQESYPQDGDCGVPQLRMDDFANPVVTLDAVQVFPNPAGQSLTVQVSDIFERGTAKLYTLHGALLYTLALEGPYTSLYLEHLDRGIYLLDVQIDDKPAVRKKIVVAR
jgi:hypothetical protein